MASPVGSLCTSIVNKTQNANYGVVMNKHGVTFTAIFRSGSAICYVPVGPLSADDLIIVNQQGQQAGAQISESRSLRVPDPSNGYAEFVTEDNANAVGNINFTFTILRYT